MSMPTKPTTWTVSDARAHFSQVVERALNEGPQTITRRGRITVVSVAATEWDRHVRPSVSLIEFFRNSPLYDSGIDLERTREFPRDIDLS